MAPRLEIPVSAGELVDKITILEIKRERIADAGKNANVRRELAALQPKLTPLLQDKPVLAELKAALHAVNEALWRIEDDIRDCERRKDFRAGFVALARAVYQTNDRRAAIKRDIDTLLGSDLVEEKSYTAYD